MPLSRPFPKRWPEWIRDQGGRVLDISLELWPYSMSAWMCRVPPNTTGSENRGRRTFAGEKKDTTAVSYYFRNVSYPEIVHVLPRPQRSLDPTGPIQRGKAKSALPASW